MNTTPTQPVYSVRTQGVHGAFKRVRRTAVALFALAIMTVGTRLYAYVPDSTQPVWIYIYAIDNGQEDMSSTYAYNSEHQVFDPLGAFVGTVESDNQIYDVNNNAVGEVVNRTY